MTDFEALDEFWKSDPDAYQAVKDRMDPAKQEERFPRWIAMGEKLPEVGRDVFIRREDGYERVARRTENGFDFAHYKSVKHQYGVTAPNFDHDSGRYTHWYEDLRTQKPPIPRCACCGTRHNLHRDLGSGGPYRCDKNICVVF